MGNPLVTATKGVILNVNFQEGYFCTGLFPNTNQCSKLRVHPAPCVHDFNAGCTTLKVVHLVCAQFPLIVRVYLSLCALYFNSGCTHFPPSALGGCTHLNLNFEHFTLYGPPPYAPVDITRHIMLSLSSKGLHIPDYIKK